MHQDSVLDGAEHKSHVVRFLKKTGFQYINQNSDEGYSIEINTALMQINSPEAVILLKKRSKELIDPSCAIDALAALSLLGYCDYAFDGFVQYVKNTNENARKLAVICLAYYVSTFDAFEILKSMKNDRSYIVQKEIIKILDNLKLNQTKWKNYTY